jgi:hypothetical protein
VTDNCESDYSIVDGKYLISREDLERVNLKHEDSIIPSPSRNMPLLKKSELKSSNKAVLDIILSVKLKPTPPIPEKTYESRHPVLRELVNKFKLKQ